MRYKKIESIKSTTPKKGNTTRAFKNAYLSFKKEFSKGTDNLADIWIKNQRKKARLKTSKLKKETMIMAKNISKKIKNELKDVTPKTVINDISHEIGGMVHETKTVMNDFFDEVKRMAHGKQ